MTASDRRTGRPWLLGSTPAFAWRTSQPVLLGWVAAACAYAAVVGALVETAAELVWTIRRTGGCSPSSASIYPT